MQTAASLGKKAKKEVMFWSKITMSVQTGDKKLGKPGRGDSLIWNDSDLKKIPVLRQLSSLWNMLSVKQ